MREKWTFFSVAKVMSSKLLVASHLSSCVRLCVAAWVDTDVTQLDSTRQQLSSFKTKIQRQIREEKRVIFHRGHSQGKNSKSATREQTQSTKVRGAQKPDKIGPKSGFFRRFDPQINWVFFDKNQR